jgi:para-nitrobenzyl esterase
MMTNDITAEAEAVALAAAAPGAAAPIVATEQGLLQGVAENGILAFKGVRYAAAPVGSLRWRPPQAPPSWDGVQQADSFGPVPPQNWLPFGPPGWAPEPQDEDSLRLNIWTPALPNGSGGGTALPVMVWIHGGAYEIGSGSTPAYHGDLLARKGVVVVTINYRLGVLGFLAHPELTAESRYSSSGNYGLMDQIEALRWVQANIAAFGGDPHNVTIFGESAGGGSVMLLSVSPLAKGLFHRAIAESGAALRPQPKDYDRPDAVVTLAQAEAAGLRFAEKVGASGIDALRAMEAKALMEAQIPGTTWPIADGNAIPGDVVTLYRAGRQHDVPVMVGWNDNEAGLFAQPTAADSFQETIRRDWGRWADKILELYPAGTDEQATLAARDLFADGIFARGSWSLAEAQRRTGTAPAFVYHFTHVPPRPEGSWGAHLPGAQHAEEIPFVFGHDPGVWTDAERRLAETIQTYWTNFARSGDPNGPELAQWPRFDGGERSVQWFADGEARTGEIPRLVQLTALDAMLGS